MAGEIHQLARYVTGFAGRRVLCLGDIMVDRYVYGEVSRVSAEAPIPIMSHRGERVMLGAVGNVARNVVALGGQARIIALVGDDEGARDVERLVAEEENLTADLVVVPGRRTTLKIRYVARGQQLLRADMEDTGPIDEESERRVIEKFRAALRDSDAVLLSDYAKGCLGEGVLRPTIEAAREAGLPIIVDPKSRDLRKYEGVTVIKPNRGELEAATEFPCLDDDSAAASARRVFDLADIGAVLVTRSEDGMTLVQRDQPPQHFKDKASEVFDVSGAGDTGLAVVGLAMAAGASISDATALANKACNIAVAKVGTAVVYAAELMQSLQSAEFASAEAKITSLMALMDKVTRWRTQGLKIGLTNGCFDLIHAGHVSLLAQAKAECDRLVVALNSDESVRRLKGDGRPINNETARAIVLASLSDVDALVKFGEDTPMRVIDAVRPDVLIKGADYSEDQVVGADFIKSYGARVFLAQLSPRLSTSDTIKKIKG